MEKEEQIYNWIKAGLSQSPTRFSEMFYFDKRENQFFSILITDYFLFEDDFSMASNVQSSYSEDTLILPTCRKMSRIEQKDTSIIEIPRLGEGLEDYEQKADSFLNLNSISIEEATLWDIEDSGSINIKITD